MRFFEQLLSLICLGSFFVVFPYLILTSVAFGNAARAAALLIQPANVWPVVLLLLVLSATVERQYFPTGATVFFYLSVMFYYGYLTFVPRLSFFIWLGLGTVVYIAIGFCWLSVKWWSVLRDPANEGRIRALADGQESKFFFDNIHRL
jgi:hypothetical protein